MKNLPKVFTCALVALGALALATSQANADSATIRSSDNAIWVAGGGDLLNYKETIPAPDLPDREHGVLPVISGGLSFMTGASQGWASNLYTSLEGSGSMGQANYYGAYQATPTVNLKAKTYEHIWTFDGKIGKGFPLGNTLMLTPYAEFGYRYWSRNLGAGDIESYQNNDFLGGAMLQFSPLNRLTLTGYGSAGTTFSAQMQNSGTTYDLGSAGMYKFGAKVGFDVTQKIELFTTLDYLHFRYVQSPVSNQTGAYEPSSSTSTATAQVGMAYHFR